VVPVLIKVDSSTGAGPTSIGDYVFNVCVYDVGLVNDEPPTKCSATAYSLSPTNFYTDKMYQVTVRVS